MLAFWTVASWVDYTLCKRHSVYQNIAKRSYTNTKYEK
ncbi:putative type IV pilus prepilin peptidase PilD [Campylobacter fetus subsp. venerealis NCTC 10354]|nr:putative type IV pilus prepilin peptidase PilD [Campylobacter fetus subsp. venerealis NCTC 10354]